MKRAAVIRATILAIVLGSIALGGVAIYLYTAPPASASAGGTSGPGSALLLTNQPGGHYITVGYNGSSYTVPAKGPNSPTFSCPTGTDPSLCTLLQQTCGNGVGHDQEPWKTCYNCVFDAGCSGDNSCDPYTRQCASPASACQVIAGGYNKAG